VICLKSFALVLILISQPAHAFQGKMSAVSISSCTTHGCVEVKSETLISDRTGRVMTGDEATLTWLDQNHEVYRQLKVIDPVLFLNSNLLTWEGDVDNKTRSGFVDLEAQTTLEK
jgi:hypothetical protein